ncbi:MAG: GNAT family N-acetyltransferase [Desulfobacteraceae bacterium]|nr:MAG: GNAT family N-acetyltransferase [Desulfobacteraceae bacterium]
MPHAPEAIWQIEKLSSLHDRHGFDCGVQDLNIFISRLAGQYQKRNLAQTYVAVPSGRKRVEGFYSLSSGAVEFDEIGEDQRRRLPRQLPIPVVLLGRLAVDSSAQGLGLGGDLLMDAMHRSLRLAEEIGIAAMVLNARDRKARQFYQRFGFVSLPHDQFHLFLSMKEIARFF